MDASPYAGGNLLARGHYSLSTDSKTVEGTIEVGSAANVLNYHFLTLLPQRGKPMQLVPRRLEHSPDGGTHLVFDFVP